MTAVRPRFLWQVDISRGLPTSRARPVVGVAQLVRASDCGSEGRGFKSLHPPHPSPEGDEMGCLAPFRGRASAASGRIDLCSEAFLRPTEIGGVLDMVLRQHGVGFGIHGDRGDTDLCRFES